MYQNSIFGLKIKFSLKIARTTYEKWTPYIFLPIGFMSVLIMITHMKELSFSAPQGPCAGLVLYSAYAATVKDVITIKRNVLRIHHKTTQHDIIKILLISVR